MSLHCTTFKGCLGKIKSAPRSFLKELLPLTVLLMGVISSAAHAQTATTTTLTLPSGSVANGSVLSMMATVSTASATLTGGTVTFRDTYNNKTQVLGTVQVQSANGTAVLQQQIGGLGAHSIVATFNALKAYSTSSSLPPPPSGNVTVTGLYPTLTSLIKTGGMAGSWSLTATVMGTGATNVWPTGNIYLLDTSNSNLQVGSGGLGAGTTGQQITSGSTSPVTVGNNPQSVAAGDFNGDGFIDLAVLNSTDKNISILKGDGSGGFIALPTPPPLTKPATGNGPVALVVADFNGDGKLDLAVANSVDGTISVFLGQGDGTFIAQTPITIPGILHETTTPTALAVGDFDGDGIADLVVVESAVNSSMVPVNGIVSVMLGDGSGTFPTAKVSQVGVGILPSSIAVGDFDGDSNMDFAVTNKTDNTLSIMMGNGNGSSFTPAAGSPISTGNGTAPAAIVAADLNGDGKLDLAVAFSGKNKLGIFGSNGSGTFTLLGTSPSTGNTPVSIVAGDFNADGNIDLAVTNSAQTKTSLLFGNGDLTFQSQITTNVGTTPTAVAGADFNGDGTIDLAVANYGSTNVSILLNQVTDAASVALTGISIPGSGSNHSISASFLPDTNFGASSSATVSLASTKITTTTSLVANPTTSTYGQQIVLTATVQPSLVGNLAPLSTETITFKDGGTTIGTAPILSGVATLNITSLVVGSHNITAVFASDTNFNASTSSPAVTITVNTATPVITWPTPTAIAYGTLLSSTQLNATTSAPGTFSYSPSAATLLSIGSHTLTATFTPTPTSPTNYTTAQATVTLVVNQATPVISWATPTPVPFGTPLSGVQLDATATSTTLVSLSSYYNVDGLTTDGSAVINGGFDGGGSSYSSNSLGTSISWNGVIYPLGPANAPDAVSNITVPLPAGNYATLNLLGALVNNVASSNTFVVTYTDGTTTTLVQNLSDWVYPKNFTNEANLKCDVARDQTGSQDPHSTCVFGYQIVLDSTKIVQSVTLPPTRNIVMLAMGLTTLPIPGTFTYTPTAGNILPVGSNTLSVSFTPADQVSYSNATGSVQLVVNPAIPALVWPVPAPINYGTPLSSTQLDAYAVTASGVTSVPLSIYYRTSAFFTDGVVYQVGGFDNNGNSYSAKQLGTSLGWNGITFPLGPPSVPNSVTSTTIGLPAGKFALLSFIGAAVNGAQTGQTFTVNYTDGTSTSAQISLSSWTQSNNYAGESIVITTNMDDTASGGQVAGLFNVYGYQIALDSTKTVKNIVLPNNLNVVVLAMSLSASAAATTNVPGTYVYTPVSGTILPAGTQALSVTFTPSDSTDNYPANKTVYLTVNKQPLVVTANSETAVYGTTIPPYTYTMTGFINGDTQKTAVTGSPSLTTSPASPTTANTYSIVAANGSLASTNYSFTFVNGLLTITKATPTVTWATPANIVYGTALSGTQLNATASVPGTFTYSPAAGSIPTTGIDTLSVTFKPNDSTDYATVTQTVQITVTQATPVITWATPAAITYGTAISAAQLNATAPILGSFSYSPVTGTIPNAGTVSLTVVFTPNDTVNYTSATKTVQLVVNQATPVITWANPAAITYGTALSGTQLNATASVAGTFTYTPALGNIPNAGTDTLSVIFKPSDTVDYTTATKTVQIVVNQATSVITWANPAAITYGTALSNTQLNATASVPGTFTYTPALGNVPAAGTDTLSVTFKPTDTVDYTTATATVQIVVNQATPVITWANPAAITYGTALSGTQLNATASVPGTFTYTPALGNVPAAGTDTLSVTFKPADAVDYTTATATVQIVVNQATSVITWATPAAITYGTALSNAQLNATASVPGTFTYTPALGNVPAAGADTLSVTFKPTDAVDYTTATATVQIVVNQATPVITWANPAAVSYGTALSNAQLNATASVAGSFAYSPALGIVPPTGTDSLSVTFTPTDATNYTTATKTVQIIVNKATPVITWANPAAITYGTALSNTQLNATTTVAGSFTYTPVGGFVPSAGIDTLSVTFTPTDTTNYTTATANVQITVSQATPIITWANPAAITYGTVLSSSQLDATASVVGSFVYTPAVGAVPVVGTDTLSVTFTPTDSTNYSIATKNVQIVVNPATPVITWSNPANITYGTALSATQLNATASVAGTFSYTPALGAIPVAGTDTLSVTFTPTDTANYSSVIKTVQIVVTQATPAITWSNPANITYGTALSAIQLNATASVAGTFAYTPALGAIPITGTDTLSVTFTPTDAANYSSVTKTVQINVTQATPVITWSDPASIPYGAALSATQLNATVSVAGTLVYTPALGAIPVAGTDTLSVTFTPTDVTNYSSVTKTVQIVVTQATPVITWSNPASIIYGTALSATQLNATASVAGTLVYTPALGAVPVAGTDTLSVTFTPTDTANYSSVTKTVQIVVTQAAPIITWSNPSSIIYGTALSSSQLNATASVAGSLVYSPAVGAVPVAGTDTLSVTFTPTDTANYSSVTKTVQIVVTQAAPVITWLDPSSITYGTALSAAQLNATASVAGSLVYTPALGAIPVAGTDTLSVTFTPTDTANYSSVTKTVQIVVTQAAPVITWSNPSSITYGTPLSATQLNATASIAGSLVYTPALGAIPVAGTDTLSVTFTPTDAANYSSVTKTVQIVVTQATPIITWANPPSITYGTALTNIQLDATASVAGSLVYTPALGAIPVAGTDTLSVTFTPTDAANYSSVTKTVQIVVTQATPVITWSNPGSIIYGTALSATQLNATASVAGSLVYTPALGAVPVVGTDTLSVTFTPTDTANYSSATKTVQIVVTQATPVITWSNPASITYGTALTNTQLNATASVAGTFAYTPALGAIPLAGTDTLSVTFTPTDAANYSSVTKTVQIVVTQAAPIITWSNPASIIYGTVLSATQLNATASVAGKLVYTPALDAIPAVGTDILSVTFTPTDAANYSSVSATVELTVTQATPLITWTNPAAITYGAALSGTQLNATASVPGAFTYTPALGNIPNAGTDTLSVTFKPTDSVNYTTTTATVQIVVNQATPVITWSDPASITYGTALSATQLNATASVPGSFIYTPATGAIPGAGTDTLSVTFTPSDAANYASVTKTVQIIVTQATPVITWSNPANITYGTALSTTQLNATASVLGSFVYTPAVGDVPSAGTGTLSVTFTPTDKVNYTTATKTVQIIVNQATPTITWNTPSAITYGTALSTVQLNATASVPGSFAYTPAAGSVPTAGIDTLSVTFTPNDTNYSSTTATVQLQVNQAIPVITWTTPAATTFGTSLSTIQLNATTSVPGTMAYTPTAGTVPPVGTDTLSVTFTPTDATNQASVTKTVQLVVNPATPVITWPTPASITYGTALSNTQLDATASVPGSFSYSPALGNVPAAGTVTLTVTFTPANTTNYTTATQTVSLTVTQATPTITWATPASITYGTALSNTQLDASASISGTLAYTPAAGSIPAAGTDTLSVTFTPTDTANYSSVTKTVQLVVSLATPVITWPTPSAVTYGTVLSSTQLNASASVPGNLVYTPAAGSTPATGTDTLSVTFTPTDTANYSSVTQTVSLTVNQAAPTITWANPANIIYGTALSTTQLNATASVAGSFTYTPAVGAIPNAGTDTLSVTFTPTDAVNYSSVTKTVQLTVTQGSVTITWANPANITYGTTLSSTQLNAIASVAGSFTYTPAAGTTPVAGTDILSVTFTPTDATNYAGATKTVQITVTQAIPVITWADPASITFGTALTAAQLNATASVTGTLVYTPALGAVPVAGTDTLSVTFTPTDAANYSSVTKTVQIVVSPASSTLSWATPASIVYGTALSNAQLDATSTVPGSFVYTPATGNVPPAGTDILSVTFTPTDTASYSASTKTVQLVVTPATPTIIWSNPASIPYGTALSATQLDATASVSGNLIYTPAIGAVPIAGTDTLSVTFTPTDTANYSSVTKTVQINVTQAAPVITWSSPASIPYGTALSATQLDATASVAGSLVYTPAMGAVPVAGTDTLSVTFTPTDTTNYASVTKTVQINVTQAAPVITWSSPAGIPYGTALSATQLDATASVAGNFVYTPAVGAVPVAGTDTLSVTFTPTDTANYASVTKTVQITVTQATPVITWSNPANITYGTALSATQLNATASVAGSLVYTPAVGAVPVAGTDTLSVTFTPTDAANYASITKTVQIVVTEATPVITWSNPANITYGTALSATQLNATASVPGSFAYTPTTGNVPAAGTDTLSVTFTPTDSSDYSSVTKTVQIVVTQAAPVITWAQPASIVYGTTLSTAQLNATASVTGTFSYNPILGSTPAAGTDTLSVTFTPADTSSYSTATATVQLTVTQASPTLTWATPADITYGTALSNAQLDATASVPGTFAYTPAVGNIPAAGTDILSVTFTPTDAVNYSAITKTVQLTVDPATPVITWPTPASIPYGTVLSTTQLDASTTVAGAFIYSPAAGTTPAVGTDTLSVTFTPTDKVSYTTATKTVPLTVTQATPTLTWNTPAAITYGTTLSTTQLDATASVPGTFVYTPAAGTTPTTGTEILSVTFTPNDAASYSSLTKTVQLTVNQATSGITWNNPAAIVYGTTLSSVQLNATSSDPGTLVYTPAAGTIPAVGTDILSVTFTPADASNYSSATKTVQIVVNPATPVITWADPASIPYGTTLSTTQLNATASVPGSFTYTPVAGSTPAAGTDTLSVTFVPSDSTNYATVTKTVDLTVTQVTPTITWANPATIPYGTTLSSAQLDATASVSGTFAYTPAVGNVPVAGTDTLSVTFTPTDATNYSSVTKTVQIVVTQATPVITWANPASITFSTALSTTQLNATASVAGTLAYTPALGAIPAAGTDTLSVTFTPNDTANYSVVTKTVQISITQATPVITWADPASITYGTALSTTQLNATASVSGSLTYTPVAGNVPAVGTDTLSVTFTPTDSANYSSVTKTVQIVITQAMSTINWADPASITYGTALSTTQLNATSSVPGTFTYTPAAGAIPAVGTDALSVTFTPTDSTSYATATKQVHVVVTQAIPTITWANPISFTYGTALSTTQLNATSSVPGTFTYTPAAGSVPAVGTDNLSVTFTPTDAASYTSVTKTVQIFVTQATPVITWTNPSGITYGAALSSAQLNATASVPGTFAYIPALGSIPAVGTDTLSVTFTPDDSTSYTSATKAVQIVVGQASSIITWAAPASITYGTSLSTTQLNATASVPGAFTYTPVVGVIPAVGTDTLSVNFTPTDTASYSTATKTVLLTVTQATPTVAWSNPASIIYGTALSAIQLNATASVPGSFTYTPAVGNVPAAGIETLSVTFTPNDTASYSTVTKTVSLTVTQGEPAITWNNPASISYGTALSNIQLNATASVNGTFSYAPSIGNVPVAGTDTLSVTFTPADVTNYSTVTKQVQIIVDQATPTIIWDVPANIPYGTTLSATQLNAVASVPGSYTYTPAAGSTLAAGTDTLNVLFTPADSSNYTTATKTVQLTVDQVTPVITWANPASITYGTALSNIQLNATSSVAGSFAYTPGAGSILAAGTDTLSVTFTPTDTANYTSVTKTVQLTVNQATPIVTWTNPSSIAYGTALSSAQLDATSSVPGQLVYTPSLGSILAAGNNTLSVTFTPTDTTNYTSITKMVQISVNQYTPIITWANPASIVYGTPLSSIQLNAVVYQPNSSTTIPGTFAYSPASGDNLMVGTQMLTVTFTPSDVSDYTTATKTVSLVVIQSALTVSADSFTRLYGTVNPTFTGSVTGSQGGDTFVESFANSATLLTQPGQYPIIPSVTGTNLADYSQIVQNGTLSIAKAPVITTMSFSTTNIAVYLPVTITTSVASTTSGTPTGTVNLFDNGNPLGSVTLNNGVGTYSTASLAVGTHVISGLYSGDVNFSSGTASAASGVNSITITPLDFTIQLTSSSTVEGTYGTTRQFTFHITPVGGSYPGTVQLSASQTGPLLATYTFSPSTIDKMGGPTDVTLTIATQKLALLESPHERSTKLSHIVLGFFLLPLLGLRYSRRSSRRLTRLVMHSLLLLSTLGAIGTLTGCGSGYSDHTYPITITANSNGIQHTVTVDFHIDQAPQ